MNIKINYRVLSCDKDNHSMVVRYWTDVLSEEDLASRFDEYGKIIYNLDDTPSQVRTDINISFYNNPNPTEEDVKNMIENGAPTLWLYNMEQVKLGNNHFNLANVESVVGTSGSFNKVYMPNLSTYLDNLVNSANT